MTEQHLLEEVFRGLAPINQLAPAAQQRLWATATQRTLSAGQLVFARATDDGLLHFVLDGSVDLIDQGRFVQRLNPTLRIARRALEGPGPKRYTARTHTPSTVVAISRAELARALDSSRLPTAIDELIGGAVPENATGDWMTRILNSDLFKVLPSEIIQTLFGTLQSIEYSTDETVIAQDDLGDYFYLLESGHCEVVRRASATRLASYVYDFRPGDTFGEAALLSGRVRDASVIALTECRLLRLPKADFAKLVSDTLVHGVDPAAALEMVRDGAQWLDIRDPEIYSKAPLSNSLNIPLNALRAQLPRLDRTHPYLVCCDEPDLSKVGTYVLAERGFNVRYLNTSIVMLLKADRTPALVTVATPVVSSQILAFPGSPAPPGPTFQPKVIAMDSMSTRAELSASAERVDRLYTQQEFNAALAIDRLPSAAFGETTTGHTLAQLMEDIDARKSAIEQDEHAIVDVTAREAGSNGADSEFIDFNVLEGSATPGLSRTIAPADSLLNAELAAALTDPVTELVHDFEQRLRNYVEGSLMERAIEIERRYQNKVTRLQENAQHQLRKRDAELKARYAAHYQKKDQILRENYQKLMTLVTKIGQQKAQLQTARQQFEEKLKAANAVYKQVEDMRRLLGENIGVVDSTPSGAAARASVR